MAPRASSISRQYVTRARHRLIVRVPTQLARLPRLVVGSRFFILDQKQIKGNGLWILRFGCG